MKCLPRVCFSAVFLAACFTVPHALRADLSDDIRSILHDKLLAKADVGISIVRLGASPAASPSLFKHESDIPLIPASNLKLVTTSAALDRLGPQFKFRTALVRRGDDIVLIGDGDPTFGDAALLKRVGWETTTVFEKWAKQLRDSGTTHVHDVLVDDSIFDQNFVHPSWPVKQQQLAYVAGVAGMDLNANCLDFYLKPAAFGETVNYVTDPPAPFLNIQNQCVTGNENAVWLSREPGSSDLELKGQIDAANVEPISVTVQDPPLFAIGVLAEEMRSAGIAIEGKVGRDRTVRASLAKLPAGSVLAIHETPLSAVLGRANKDSMNLYAEALCKRLGAEVSGQSGSWENGLPVLKAFLTKAGVDPSQYSLDDGCGLSHKNAISPAALTQVLCYDYFGPNKQAFMESMGIAGVDGRYLQTRFAGTDLRGRVLLKSGFVNNVSGITGYLHAKDGQWYVFSILMNRIPDGSNSGAKSLQEKIVKALDASVAPLEGASASGQ
jgi:D-alanyl-D-alanine carboxypeptidase/D-alanyl-D-alanine-endopeptidase (penicillin-binding protein 4)